METATTLVVAKNFDKSAISLLNLSDHLIQVDTLYTYTKEGALIEVETDEKIREEALYCRLMPQSLNNQLRYQEFERAAKQGGILNEKQG